MDKIVIIGAGGFGREVQWLIERINENRPAWELQGFIDDGIEKGTLIHGCPVLGCVADLLYWNETLSVVCAVASPRVRERIINSISQNRNLVFPSLIDPEALYSDKVKLGQGNVICAGAVLTVDIEIGDFNIVNLECTIGHDVKLSSFVTIYPNVSVSGNVCLHNFTEIGTGTQIIQGITVGQGTVIGAGAVVIRDLPEECTAVGNPAKPVRYHKTGG